MVVAGVVVCALGCSPSRDQPEGSAAARGVAAEKRYVLKGTVVSVDKPAKRLTVDHEPIEGLMDAMRMPYAVRDGRALDNLSPGEQVTATLVSANGGYWLDEIRVAKPAPAKP
jgi:Cu/Ag efflux protein CusF